MNKLLAVIRREYLSRVRNKWFVFSTLLIPVLMVGVIGLPALLVVGQQPEAVQISVIDMTGELLPELLETEAFRGGSFFFVAPPAGDRQVVARDLLTEWIADEELGGYLYVPADVLEGGRVEYWGRGRNVSNPLVVPRPDLI